MTARITLSELIETLRGMTDAGPDDYTINNVDYWSDDMMQRVLDRHRRDVFREQLRPIESVAGGGIVEYREYRSQYTNFERTDGGTALFFVEDSLGNKAGTATYSVDYLNGRITFADDQAGKVYYLTGRSYDLNAAAADIWRQKAGHYATSVNFSTDNHRIDRGAIINNCLNMAAHYEMQAGPTTIRFDRGDMVGEGLVK